jgi:hypothetical protein
MLSGGKNEELATAGQDVERLSEKAIVKINRSAYNYLQAN